MGIRGLGVHVWKPVSREDRAADRTPSRHRFVYWLTTCALAALLLLLLSAPPAPLAGSNASAGENVFARPALCVGAHGAKACKASAAVNRSKKMKSAAKSCTTKAQKRTKKCIAQVRKSAKKTANKKSSSSTNADATPASSLPEGYGPAQFRSAYNLPSAAARVQTIAIVSAYDSPNIEKDLAVYSKTFSLPVCSSKNGCFRKVNAAGKKAPLPVRNALWALETSLDVEVAHAVCSNCKILLVEADASSVNDLTAALDTAVELGADVISNSWVVDEFRGETALDSHFNRPGIAITAASGDAGYGVTWPAASPYVTAVGGTTLEVDSSNARVSESAWDLGGSGCSAYESKPTWQSDGGCTHRTVPDVAAVANPSTGAAVYDSYGYQGESGWMKIGGTSVAAPLVAAAYALAGNAADVVAGSYPYTHSSSLFDIKDGVNGSCSTAYLCNAGTGYDGPSGLGSPAGVAAL
jgi:subtilase family serine protease